MIKERADVNIGFAWLRLIGAGIVIFEHSASLAEAGRQTVLPGQWQVSAGYIALLAFFAMSGFQISDSWRRDPVWWVFAAKRVLRLMPPLLVVLVVTVFVIGPLFTTAGDYWTNAQTWRYLGLTPLLFTMQYRLPGVFVDNPYPWAVNGSLWTLPLEVVGYGIVLCFGMAVAIGAPRLLLFPLAGGLVALSSRFSVDTDYLGALSGFVGLPIGHLVTFMIPFVIGMILHAYRGRIPLSPVAAGLIAVVWLTMHAWGSPVAGYLLPLMASYGAVVLAHHWPKRLEVDGRWVYGSYGLYIWGFPIQQMLVASGVHEVWLLALLAVPISYACGTLSWIFVEAPSQRLRRFLPRPTRLPPMRGDELSAVAAPR